MAKPKEAPTDPRQLAAQLQFVQRELSRAQEQLDAIQGALVEANQAAATLKSLGEAAKGEILVPIGAGVHLHATLTDASPVFPVGAGYAIEASPEAALATLQRRIQDITESFNRTAERAEELAGAGAQIDSLLSRLPPAEEGNRDEEFV
ncbi:MAG: prefoldin subunit alpha [Thermoplasmatota archaeon]